MILGIGSDICDIRRIEKTLERHGRRFEERIFTNAEQAKARSRKGTKNNSAAAIYAKRFAAKEAFSKALGTGVGAGGGIYWRDIEVVNLPSGKPTIALSGNAKRSLDDLTPKGMRAEILITLTDEYPIAQAFVVIQAIV